MVGNNIFISCTRKNLEVDPLSKSINLSLSRCKTQHSSRYLFSKHFYIYSTLLFFFKYIMMSFILFIRLIEWQTPDLAVEASEVALAPVDGEEVVAAGVAVDVVVVRRMRRNGCLSPSLVV